ncbi:MAG TPA: PEGA domain-containing protein, partial [Bacteroidales bacterium]|nr:PEGA domain-containing protein [Bacteroidales bacterium]
QKSISVKINLKPKWGKLKINVSPKNATIRIDGKVQGTGNLDLTTVEEALNIGSYDVEATLDGYTPQRQTVKVTNDKIAVLDFVLEPIKGFIKVTSS